MHYFSVRYYRWLFSCLLLCAVVLLTPSSAFAAPATNSGSLSLSVQRSTFSYTVRVLTIREGEQQLVDLESMARALRLSFSREPEAIVLKEPFTNSNVRCTVAAGNPFVVVQPASSGGNPLLVQLQATPVMRQSRLYLPVEQACRLFSLWLERDVRYQPSSGRIQAMLKGKAVVPAFLAEARQRQRTTSIAVASNAHCRATTVITGFAVDERANGAIIRFTASGPPATFSLVSPQPDSSGTVQLQFEQTTPSPRLRFQRFNGALVRSITPQQKSGQPLHFTIVLDSRFQFVTPLEAQYDKASNRYELLVRTEANVEEILRREKEQHIAQTLSHDVAKWKLDTIVLDAGHGGKDPGAIGLRGTQEKDVVLNIVRDLGNFIEQQWSDVRVIYTRSNDTFVPLHERGRLANKSGGKLFISVHCNASPNRSARGSEVYILGAHKNSAALNVAMMENAVIRNEVDYQESYKGFSEEYLIMSSMAQSAFSRQSTLLAQQIIRPVAEKQEGNNRGVRQAGFMVLWTPSMPSALVEVGYISHPAEELLLRDRQRQKAVAYAIFKGIERYRKSYESNVMAALN
jgi:N-acetylmuramoyl-L-alanine amidase